MNAPKMEAPKVGGMPAAGGQNMTKTAAAGAALNMAAGMMSNKNSLEQENMALKEQIKEVMDMMALFRQRLDEAEEAEAKYEIAAPELKRVSLLLEEKSDAVEVLQ